MKGLHEHHSRPNQKKRLADALLQLDTTTRDFTEFVSTLIRRYDRHEHLLGRVVERLHPIERIKRL